MVHQVFANSGVAAGQECDFQLGSHPVGGTHQHRLLIAVKLIAGSEAAYPCQHGRGHGLTGQHLDSRYGLVGLVDVDARVFVAHLCFILHRFRLHLSEEFL